MVYKVFGLYSNMQIEKTAKRAVSLLRKYGELEEKGRPALELSHGTIRPINVAAYYPWNRDNPDFWARTGDTLGEFQRLYNETFEDVEYVDCNIDFYREYMSAVPDTEECVVVDTGSSLGRISSRLIAEKKSNVRVYMIDKMGFEDIEKLGDFEAASDSENFARQLKRVPRAGKSVEEWVNEMLHHSGYRNIEYVSMEMVHKDDGSSNLMDLERYLSTRRVFFMGMNNPCGLGNITLRESIHYRGEAVAISNSGLDRTKPQGRGWDLMRGWLKTYMTEPEIEKVVDLTYDPQSNKSRRVSRETEKYNYDKVPEKMFSITMKGLFALPQIDMLQDSGYNVVVYTYPDRVHQTHNGPSHIIWARQTSIP